MNWGKQYNSIKRFSDLLIDLEEEGLNLDPINLVYEVDNSSLTFLEKRFLNPMVLGTDAEKVLFSFNASINVLPMLEKSVDHNFHLDLENYNEPEFIVAHDVNDQGKNPLMKMHLIIVTFSDAEC